MLNNQVMTQRTFNDAVAPSILNANEAHMACVFVLDTSGSMYGTPINELEKGFEGFINAIRDDETTRTRVDVGVVAFNSTHRVLQKFAPAPYIEPVKLKAEGGTEMSEALREAIKMVTERSKFYLDTGSQPYKPWIVLVSDGKPQDDITSVVNEIQGLEQQGKLKVFSLGVGDYDPETLHRLSGPKVMKLDGYDFTEFFDWTAKSMRSISTSSPGEAPVGVPLPESVDKDTSDWVA